MKRRSWPRTPLLARTITWVALATTVGIVLWQVHPALLLSSTTDTGGDTGAHVIMASWMASHLLTHFHLTGWYPWWFDGMPIYSFYFIFPDLLAAIAGYVIPYAVAFKLATIAGSLMLPPAAYAFGRLAGMERPYPAVLGVFTLPFLFDQSFTILGGNLFSTFAGEYSYSFGMALALIVLGLTFRGLRTGRYRAITALILAICVLSHLVAALFVTAGMLAALALCRPSARRTWWVVSTGGVAALLAGFWELPFVAYQSYTTSMGYVNTTHFMKMLYPVADRWAIWLALAGLVFAVVKRSRPAMLLSLLAAIFAVGFVLDPQGKLWNERLIPVWLLCMYLMAGYATAYLGVAAAKLWKRWRTVSYRRPEHLTRRFIERMERYRSVPRRPGEIGAPIAATALCLAVVLPSVLVSPTSSGVDLFNVVHIEHNNVTDWAAWNYSGYQSKPAWPEFHGLMQEMSRIGSRYGCGQAMWEYSHSLNRFGTTEALFTLPYWTHYCMGSLGGLLFESSPTTPYYFMVQSELSPAPSDAMAGLPYGPFNMELGIEHLQMMGVRYFMASSPSVQAAAKADHNLSLVATSGPWRSEYNGRMLDTTWKVYLVHHAAPVKALTRMPVVLRDTGASPTSWLPISLRWFDTPKDWNTYLLSGNLPSPARSSPTWPSGTSLPPDKVTGIRMGTSTISFTVSKVGVPVVVDVSYYPAWHATGASGPYRAVPNFMVVIPHSHEVTLHYGSTPAGSAGVALSGLGVLGWLGLAVRRRLLLVRRNR
ncbi:MAG: hypothetical protein M1350_03340 [Actinobacteria bacterium]|jgi:hypothetical protein|nr:hypothetical protein [Actinomycetota bacterium]